jgi:hypothetical protein
MEVEYKGFKGEKILDNGKELIVLSGEDIDEIVWIEDDEIRATDIDKLKKTLTKYNITDKKIREEKLHPGLLHYIVDI